MSLLRKWMIPTLNDVHTSNEVHLPVGPLTDEVVMSNAGKINDD
jgi:hypothetical protein